MTALPPAMRFTLLGTVMPLVKGASLAGWKPTRPMGGWLIVYGLLANGGVVPIMDRDRQVFDAASRPDGIDVSQYLAKGIWNDTHRKGTVVGVPTSLEYHGPTSELAKAHGKVGWWTDGYLLDPADPQGWERRGLTPTHNDLARSNFFWTAAQMLKGTPRPLGLSAEGSMALSSDGGSITWAKLQDAAMCEVPVNPGSTVEIRELIKAVTANSTSFRNLVQEDLEGSGKTNASLRDTKIGPKAVDVDAIKDARARIVQQIMQIRKVSKTEAERWVTLYLRRQAQQRSS